MLKQLLLCKLVGKRVNICKPSEDGAKIDARSTSRYGVRDFGTNASRIRSLLEDIDDAASDDSTQKKAAMKAAKTANQPPAKGARPAPTKR